MAESIQRIGPSSVVQEQRDRRRAGKLERKFESFASRTSHVIGSSWSFGVATLLVVAWAFTGPVFHYSDTWQLVINTSTTIITFLMVFLLQHSQNKDGMAIQLKLDEIIAAVEGASNHMIDIEDLSEDDLLDLKDRYQKLVVEINEAHTARCSTSVDNDDRQQQRGADQTSE